MVQDSVKNLIHAPEGEWKLHSSKSHSCSFLAVRPARLTFAAVETQPDPLRLIIYNNSDALNIATYAAVDKPPHRQILVSGGAHTVYPTCHDHAQNVSGYDLLVGLSSGDVVLGSVQAQLKAPSTTVKMLDMVHFNKAGQIDPSRAVDVAFLPGSHGGYFLAAHESGNIYTYCSASGKSASSGGSPSSKIPQQNGCPKPIATLKIPDKELRSCAVSPDGSKVASTTKDGILYVHDVSTNNLVGGFKSFYGGLHCCAWSYDSRYVAAAGEDDLVCVYGLLEQRQVFFGEGHESWITRISFDRWQSNIEESQNDGLQNGGDRMFSGPERITYRIASVGQDCRVLFWDFVAEDEHYFGSDEEQSRALNQAPSGIHKRTPSSSAVNFLAANPEGSANGLPAAIQPAVKRSQMDLSPPVASQSIHSDPCSDVIFIKDAMYTVTYCCEMKCWLRPNRP